MPDLTTNEALDVESRRANFFYPDSNIIKSEFEGRKRTGQLIRGAGRGYPQHYIFREAGSADIFLSIRNVPSEAKEKSESADPTVTLEAVKIDTHHGALLYLTSDEEHNRAVGPVQQGGVAPDPQPSNPMAHYYQSDGSHVRPRLDGTTTVYSVEQCNNFTVFWGKCSCSPGGLKQWDDGPEYHVGHDDYVRPCTPCTEGKPLVQR